MDFGGPGERSIPEIWFEPADPHRFAALLGRVLTVVAAVTAATGIAATLVLTERIERNELLEDEHLAEAIAAAPAQARAGLAAAAGREAMIVALDGPGPTAPGFDIEVIVAATPPDGQTLAWLRAVARRRAVAESNQFDSVAPDGQRWWHTTAAIDDDNLLVLQRPRARAMATASALLTWMVGLAVVVTAGLAGLWLLLRRPFEQSTTRLLEAVEDLRILGRLRGGVRSRLLSMPSRPIELKRLANSIIEIEQNTGRTFAQADSLLRAAAVLGSSLDPDVVLTASLTRLEELLGADRSAIFRYDHRLNSFDVVATHGHLDRYLDDMTEAGAHSGMPSVQAVRRQIPIQVSDTESEFTLQALRHRARANGYRSVLAVPLPPVLERPTVLVVHKAEPHTYSYDEIDLSMSFASIAAAALRNAELFARTDDDLSRQSSRLTAIIESVHEGILVESTDRTVIYANSTMRALADPCPGAVGGSTEAFLSTVLRSADDPALAAVRIAEMSDDNGRCCDVELGSDDGPRTFRVRSFDVSDARGGLVGRGLVWTDVTADRALDEMKAGLLATISHEFRTPLALIKGYATTLLADDVDWTPTDRDDFLRLVVSEADRLTVLVQRLLDLRRIDAGLVDLNTVQVELEAVIARALGGVGANRHRVQVQTVPRLLMTVDETRLATALRNLIENACQYSPDDAPVTITITVPDEVATDAGVVTIEVADRGPGIPDELKSTVFDVFVRGEPLSGLNRDDSGTGLGLAIARGFVEAHGGRLSVGDRPGGGSVFRATVPLVPLGGDANAVVAGQTLTMAGQR